MSTTGFVPDLWAGRFTEHSESPCTTGTCYTLQKVGWNWASPGRYRACDLPVLSHVRPHLRCVPLIHGPINLVAALGQQSAWFPHPANSWVASSQVCLEIDRARSGCTQAHDFGFRAIRTPVAGTLLAMRFRKSLRAIPATVAVAERLRTSCAQFVDMLPREPRRLGACQGAHEGR